MAVKTRFSKKEFIQILSDYNIGDYKSSKPITDGTVQTNILIQTTKGRFVFRYYECRSKGSVLFESNLINYLTGKKYPCPAQLRNKHGEFVGTHSKKPYIIFEFIEGKHIEHPTQKQKQHFIKKVAELQNITKKYKPINRKHRLNYNIRTCRKLAKDEANKINTTNAREKLKWYSNELSKLDLPKSLPKGICHADFHFSNVLYKNGKFTALLDFDDANYTYLMFDLIGLIEYWAWPHKGSLNLKKAKKIIQEFEKHRQLNVNEKKHFLDVYKLSILIDCIWFFGRGNAKDFYEKRKIEYLDNLGKEKFYNELFG